MENMGVGYEPKLHGVEDGFAMHGCIHWQNDVSFSVHFLMIPNIIWLLLSIELALP